jgi:hypothetical protein
MQVFVGGKGGPEVPIHAKNGVPLNISSVVAITVNPVVTAPTGDSTYLRLDNGNGLAVGEAGTTANNAFTGNNSHSGTETFTGGVTISTSPYSTTAAGTHSGTETFTGQVIASNANGTVYVGGSIPQIGGSADIGAQINAAYAAMPSTGGKLFLLPQTGGGCYNYSTPIVLNTAGKYMPIEGVYTGTAPGGALMVGSCLDYTPTTATTAITIDYGPVGGGGGNGNTILKNLTLGNNGCVTVGGCGSSATGVIMGPNGGAHFGVAENVRISGFGLGSTVSAGVGWGILFEHSTAIFNTTGISFPVITENFKWHSGAILGNGTGVSCTTNSGVTFESVSFDINSTTAINNTSCNITLIAPWFENAGGVGAQYITQSGGQFSIEGGQVLDDATTGTNPQFFTASGGAFSIFGISAFSGGRTVTNFVNNTGGGTGTVRYINDISPSLIAPGVGATCAIAYSCIVEQNIGGTPKLSVPTLLLTFEGAGAPAGVAGNGLLYYDASLNVTRINDNNTGALTLTKTASSGTAAMTTAGILTGACGTTVTVAATGVLTTDVIDVTRNAAATIGNGGGLTLNAWPTAGNVNFNYCNSSAGTITPTAMTINWSVVR